MDTSTSQVICFLNSAAEAIFYLCKSHNINSFRFFLHPGDTVVVRAQERGPTFKGAMYFWKKKKLYMAKCSLFYFVTLLRFVELERGD
jgi:hypothetical protein